ncbi:MAG: alpha/beta fold hydrolase [Solirubrobacterales bacterium]
MIEETTVDVDGVRVFYRRVPGEGVPVLFVHGNPTHSEDWVPFLRRLRGPAIALDLPGWGRSERPPAERFDGSMHGLATLVSRFLDVLGVDRYRLVVHDWGGLVLILAQREPDRVQRVVIVNTVPLLPGYRWHWLARCFWRRPLAGELFLATVTRPGIALILRQARADRGPMPDEFVDMIWSCFDRGTKRAILELYRSAPAGALADAGARLGELECPALVVWGARDPYIPVEFGRGYRDRLPNAELVEVPDAGHWPWVERPALIPRIVEFLEPG